MFLIILKLSNEVCEIRNFYDETMVNDGFCKWHLKTGSTILKQDTYSSRSSSDNDGDAPQKADILDELIFSERKPKGEPA